MLKLYKALYSTLVMIFTKSKYGVVTAGQSVTPGFVSKSHAVWVNLKSNILHLWSKSTRSTGFQDYLINNVN